MAPQLIAGELPGTYVLSDAETDQQLMELAQRMAKAGFAKGG